MMMTRSVAFRAFIIVSVAVAAAAAAAAAGTDHQEGKENIRNLQGQSMSPSPVIMTYPTGVPETMIPVATTTMPSPTTTMPYFPTTVTTTPPSSSRTSLPSSTILPSFEQCVAGGPGVRGRRFLEWGVSPKKVFFFKENVNLEGNGNSFSFLYLLFSFPF